jgi:SNF2 family DNA or RNA helicase
MPMSVLASWKTDLKKFAPNITVFIHHGTKEERLHQFSKWSHKFQKMKSKSSSSGNNTVYVVLTTYELAIRDNSLFANFKKKVCPWEYLVVSINIFQFSFPF